MAERRFIGWALDRGQRDELLERFTPSYPDVIADHVTLAMSSDPQAELPTEHSGRIVGRADDGEGVEALVVEIGGSTRRPDGSVFHITWSLDRSRGRKPVESNDVIADHGWDAWSEPVRIRLEPRGYPQ